MPRATPKPRSVTPGAAQSSQAVVGRRGRCSVCHCIRGHRDWRARFDRKESNGHEGQRQRARGQRVWGRGSVKDVVQGQKDVARHWFQLRRGWNRAKEQRISQGPVSFSAQSKREGLFVHESGSDIGFADAVAQKQRQGSTSDTGCFGTAAKGEGEVSHSQGPKSLQLIQEQQGCRERAQEPKRQRLGKSLCRLSAVSETHVPQPQEAYQEVRPRRTGSARSGPGHALSADRLLQEDLVWQAANPPESEVLTMQLENRHEEATLQVVLGLRATHQASSDSGNWQVAWLLTHLEDPMQRRRFGREQSQLETVAAYLKSQQELEKRSKQARFGNRAETENPDEQAERATDPEKDKERRARKGAGKGQSN